MNPAQTMESIVYGSLSQGLEVANRDGRLYVRLDAGSHMIQWREDEITESEFGRIIEGGASCTRALLDIQQRLLASGVDVHRSNWSPDR